MSCDKKWFKGKCILLEGSPWERGLIYGESCKQLISEVVERWEYSLLKGFGEDPKSLIDLFIEETGFVSTVKRVSPELLKEVEGIGEGADVDFDTIFALQCMDEGWWFFPEKDVSSGVGGCSVVGIPKIGGYPTILSQNMDIPSVFQGTDVLLRIKNHRHSVQSIVYTFAGMIALCGISDRPLGICCNTLIDLNHSETGLPVAFLVREVLEKSNLEKAIEFIKRIEHASGQNYSIGDSERVVALECSANKVCRHEPFKEGGRVIHTNHPLVNDDLVFPPRKVFGSGTSHVRYSYLNFRIEPPKRVDLDTVKGILSSHYGPVCVHPMGKPDKAYTFGSLVYLLSDTPEMHLARGPPCRTKYEIHTFR